MTRALPEKLYYGSHEPDGVMCAWEAVNWRRGAEWSDGCGPDESPVLRSYVIAINDGMGDEVRQRLLPYVDRLIGTRLTRVAEQRRAYRAADWAVRRFASSALLSAGMESEARTLQELPPIVDEGTARAAAAEAAAARAAAAAAAAEGDMALLCLDDLLSVTEGAGEQ